MQQNRRKTGFRQGADLIPVGADLTPVRGLDFGKRRLKL